MLELWPTEWQLRQEMEHGGVTDHRRRKDSSCGEINVKFSCGLGWMDMGDYGGYD